MSPPPRISCETLVLLQLLLAQSLVTGHKVSSVEEREGWIKDHSKPRARHSLQANSKPRNGSAVRLEYFFLVLQLLFEYAIS